MVVTAAVRDLEAQEMVQQRCQLLGSGTNAMPKACFQRAYGHSVWTKVPGKPSHHGQDGGRCGIVLLRGEREYQTGGKKVKM